jgi:Ca2+-binding RTX toxin-like protein
MSVFWGTAAADVILGSAGADQIYGQAGNDTLYGSGGNDWLNGGAGDDLMGGGLGDDVYYVAAAGDAVLERAGEGTDWVLAWVSYQLAVNVEHLTLSGTADLTGMGNALNNTLIGNAGNNILNGAAGDDRLVGGEGNDVYLVGAADDRVVEQAGEGNDKVLAWVNHQLSVNVETLILQGAAAINGTGNALNNTITGNAGNNVLNGAAGDDLLIGGKGNDIYYVAAAGDRVVEQAGEGADQVLAWISHQLAANVEILVLQGTSAINGAGNALNNTIIGNAGDNVLNGGVGSDTLAGGKGNDVYDVDSVGDRVQEAANEGYDRVRASASFTLGANIEELNLTGSAAIKGTGNALNNTIVGNSGANLLTGGAGDDVLIGGDGNDQIRGGAGKDKLMGGVGSDRLDVTWSDLIAGEIYDGGEGVDTLSAGSSDLSKITLSGIEILSGSAVSMTAAQLGGFQSIEVWRITIVGGGVADLSDATDLYWDVIQLSDVGNTLMLSASTRPGGIVSGGAGSDVVTAPVGAALIYGNAGDDTLTGGTGQNWLDGGAGDDHIIGGVGNDLLYGQDGDDVLNGGVGNDTFTGALGEDTLTGGLGADTFLLFPDPSFLSLERDTITDFSHSQGDKFIIKSFDIFSFSYRGSGSFTATGRTEARFADGELLIDSFGDGTADVIVTLTGVTSASQIAATDFVLDWL